MSEKTLKLARGYILVKKIEDRVTDGGIHLPDDHRKHIVSGTVLNATPPASEGLRSVLLEFVACCVEETDNGPSRGDTVYYPEVAGYPFADGTLLRYSDVVAWEG